MNSARLNLQYQLQNKYCNDINLLKHLITKRLTTPDHMNNAMRDEMAYVI